MTCRSSTPYGSWTSCSNSELAFCSLSFYFSHLSPVPFKTMGPCSNKHFQGSVRTRAQAKHLVLEMGAPPQRDNGTQGHVARPLEINYKMSSRTVCVVSDIQLASSSSCAPSSLSFLPHFNTISCSYVSIFIYLV